jgi:hypothetical protein
LTQLYCIYKEHDREHNAVHNNNINNNNNNSNNNNAEKGEGTCTFFNYHVEMGIKLWENRLIV